ncbi:helix-turn-helix domain-containing protein [Tissierella praeacuta]|uniref:helix-turn-helix domain-containing protein n=1 Tax=Tissierella praeacuta TaxID=43131 RepID=UPI003DA43FC2
MDTSKILERIEFLTNKNGMTIAELERKANVGNGVIRRWGKSIPTSDKLLRVANILGTSMEYLLLGEEGNQNEKAKILAREANNLTDVQLDLIRSMIKEFDKQNKK